MEAVKRKLGVRTGLRPVRHALLPARLGLRRGHALPVDDERLLADGRHRMRHRETAARAGRRQRPRRRHADVPQPLGAYRQDRCPRRAAASRAGLDPLSLPVELQTALDALYGHYKKTFELWQEAGSASRRSSSSSATTRPPRTHLRIRLRLRPPERGRHRRHARRRPPCPVPQLRRLRQPPRRAPTRS